MLHGPHNGPHVSQLSRTYQKLLKSHEPLIATQSSDPVETNGVVMEHAIQDMINDWFMDEGEEDPCGNFNSKDGDETYNKVKKETQIPIYNGAKVSKLSEHCFCWICKQLMGGATIMLILCLGTFDFFSKCKVLLLVKVIDFNIFSNE